MLVLNKNTKRETGRKAQRSNITAAVNVAAIVRTTLGPKAMLKMLLDPMGGIVLLLANYKGNINYLETVSEVLPDSSRAENQLCM